MLMMMVNTASRRSVHGGGQEDHQELQPRGPGPAGVRDALPPRLDAAGLRPALSLTMRNTY